MNGEYFIFIVSLIPVLTQSDNIIKEVFLFLFILYGSISKDSFSDEIACYFNNFSLKIQTLWTLLIQTILTLYVRYPCHGPNLVSIINSKDWLSVLLHLLFIQYFGFNLSFVHLFDISRSNGSMLILPLTFFFSFDFSSFILFIQHLLNVNQVNHGLYLCVI